MKDDPIDQGRRRFLTVATTVVGGLGLAAAGAPFLRSWSPSRKAQALGAPVQVDISQMSMGSQLTVEWRGQPIWIIRRSKEMLARLSSLSDHLRDPDSEQLTQQPDYARNIYRAIDPEFLVLIGLCTHLGCVPTYRPDLGGIDANWPGGFFCPCHGSKFDLAGRVYKGVPAPSNLQVPPHYYRDNHLLIIGEEGPVA